jgi:single-strand DNA-binding protein
MSVNKVIIVGNLGSDPEVLTFGEKKSLCKFSVATSEGKDKEPEWHTAVCFGELGEHAAKHLKKGSQVYVEGKLSSRRYETKSGEKHKVSEIVANSLQFLGSGRAKEVQEIEAAGE